MRRGIRSPFPPVFFSSTETVILQGLFHSKLMGLPEESKTDEGGTQANDEGQGGEGARAAAQSTRAARAGILVISRSWLDFLVRVDIVDEGFWVFGGAD